MRIIVFGGAQVNIALPVSNRYVVLDVKTLEWHHGKEDPSTRAPFRHHTASLHNDYMFIAFGKYYTLKIYNLFNDFLFRLSQYKRNSDDALIYKIGDYANFTEVNNF